MLGVGSIFNFLPPRLQYAVKSVPRKQIVREGFWLYFCNAEKTTEEVLSAQTLF